MKRTQAWLVVAVFMWLPGAVLATPTVDWDADGSFNGAAAGVLDGASVALDSTDGSGAGGSTLATTLTTSLAFDGVPGIADADVIQELAVIDWNPGAVGTATITFSAAISDPVLLFTFLDSRVATFDFADALTITVLDQNPAASVTIVAGNVVTTNASHAETVDDGFAIQLSGNFTSITFATNVNLVSPSDSVGFTVMGEATCGNGEIDDAEECDFGDANGTQCCTASCAFASSGTECLASTGACDLAETCSGSSELCPDDGGILPDCDCEDDEGSSGGDNCPANAADDDEVSS